MLWKKISNEDLDKVFILRDKFVEYIDGRPLLPSQKSLSNIIIKSILNNDGDIIVGEFSRQTGKSTILSRTGVFLILFYFQICKKIGIKLFNEFNIGNFAPQQEQAKSIFNMMKDFLILCKEKGFDIDFTTFNGNTIILEGNFKRQIFCSTASPTSKPESKTFHLIIYDEAQDLVDRQVEKAIMPMGSSTNATQCFIGVAGYQRCKFWKLIETLPQQYKVILPKIEALKERRLMYEATKNNLYLAYEEYLKNQIKLNGISETSDHFATQYDLRWILERGQFIDYEKLMRLKQSYNLYEEYAKPVFAGIDWGKKHDSTIITFVDEDCFLLEWLAYKGDDYTTQINNITQHIKQKYINCKIINCDSTGTQDMAVDVLRSKINEARLTALVQPINFSTHKDSMYKNLHRLMFDVVMDGKVIEKAKIKIPQNLEGTENFDRFIKEFLDLQKEIKNNKWHCQHPEGPQYHDDYCDSLALAVYSFKPILQRTQDRFLFV